MAINSRNGNTLLESGFFAPVRAATTAAITLAGLQTVDGVALAEGDRVLVKDQADQTTNGIYAATSGNWLRTSDAAGNTDFFSGMAVLVALGSVNAGQIYLCTCADDPVLIGTSLLTFASQGAVQQALQQATSASSAALTTGAKTFATQSGKSFSAKQWLLIYQTSNPDNRLLAEISSYAAGSLVVNVVAVDGSGGPYADWTIVLTNTPAVAGRQPPAGTGNVTGPGSAVDGHLVVFDGPTGKLTKDIGLVAGVLASRNSLQYGDAGSASIGTAALADDAAALPPVNSNLAVSNNGLNPTRDFDVSAGRVRDDSDAANMRLVAALTKRLDLAFAPGTNAGALASGSSKLASKTYHEYLIGRLGLAVTNRLRVTNVATLAIAAHGLGVGGSIRVVGIGSGYDGHAIVSAVPDSGHVSYANTGADEGSTAATGTLDAFDVCAERSDLSLTLPVGWTVKQALWSLLTDGSANIIAFKGLGDVCELVSSVLDVNVVNPGTAAVTRTLSVPLGVSVIAKMQVAPWQNSPAIAVVVRISPLDTTDETAVLAAVGAYNADAGGGSSSLATGGVFYCRTNSSGQLRSRLNLSDGNTNLFIRTLGWIDPRRRLF